MSFVAMEISTFFLTSPQGMSAGKKKTCCFAMKASDFAAVLVELSATVAAKLMMSPSAGLIAVNSLSRCIRPPCPYGAD